MRCVFAGLLMMSACLAMLACDDDDDKGDVTKKPSTEQGGSTDETSNPSDPGASSQASAPGEPGYAVGDIDYGGADAPGSARNPAETLLLDMGVGINIGNTMEVPYKEGVEVNDGNYGPWSGVKVNQAYIRGLKALGFNAVRIPCAWNSHLSKIDNRNLSWTIDAKWLATVEEVVDWITAEGMYAVLNIHWDGGWLEESISKGVTKSVDARQKSLWTQIATHFNKYDQHLLFAGMNEPSVSDADKKDEQKKRTGFETIMHYSQTFVDAVRATGGNNARRVLVVQMPATNIDDGLSDIFHMPTDQVQGVEQKGYLMAEFHYYGPYQFCLMENDEDWGKVFLYWGSGNHVSGSKRNADWGEEDYVVKEFAKLKVKFTDNHIPLVLGECSTQSKPKLDLSTCDVVPYDEAKHHASRALWNEVVFREARKNGCCAFYWETGGEINRVDGTWKADCQYSLDAIMKGAGN